MSSPQDDLPTTVIGQQTVEQPAVTTSPATRGARVWHRRIPQRIGRARTSTVVIAALFVLLGGLNFVLPQQDPLREVTLPNGDTVQVRESQYTPAPTTPTAPSTTAPAAPTGAPSSTATPTGTRAPSTTAGEDEEETTPSTTARDTTTPAPTSTRATTSRAPSTTATTEQTQEEEQSPEETAEPTG